MPVVERQDCGSLCVRAGRISVSWDPDEPDYFVLDFPSFSQRCFIPGRCDIESRPDFTGEQTAMSVEDAGATVLLTWSYSSSIWQEKSYVLSITEQSATFVVHVVGQHRIAQLTYFEGLRRAGSALPNFRIKHLHDGRKPDFESFTESAQPGFARIGLIDPNVHGRNELSSACFAHTGCSWDVTFLGGSMIFNPGLLAFVMHNGTNGERVAVGLAPEDGQQRFCRFEYVGNGTFGFRVPYEVEERVDGVWTGPSLVFAVGDTELDALKHYVGTVRGKSNVHRPPSADRQEWWSRPIVCGWGHQSYIADLFRTRSHRGRTRDNGPNMLNIQVLYESFVRGLDELGIDWGSLIIDAGWSYQSGRKQVDSGKWPNLRAFVDDLHRGDRRALIWWAPWECDGLNAEHCIRYTGPTKRLADGRVLTTGEKLAPDISLPAVREFLRGRIEAMLSSDHGYGLDGLKLDHLSLVPCDGKLMFPLASSELYGIELVREYCVFLQEAAKLARPDCLIIGHAPSPYLVDCFDMVRIGPTYVPDESAFVGEMLRRAELVSLVSSDWLIDTDGWPLPSLSTLLRYAEVQPKIGVPALYYSTHIDVSGEQLTAQVAANVNRAWHRR